MQNRLQFLHPKVGARIFFSRILPLGCGRHSARCFSFGGVLDILQSTGLFVLTTPATAKAKNDTDHPKEPFFGDLKSPDLLSSCSKKGGEAKYE